MLCVAVDVSGAVYVVDPQPVDTAACGLVIVSGLEAHSSPWSLTLEQGSQVGGAILAVWALAFVFRVVIRALNVDQNGDSTT